MPTVCFRCGRPGRGSECPNCGSTSFVAQSAPLATCPDCSEENSGENTRCWNCDARL